MDKNQATGLVLMAALLMIYFYFFAPQPVEAPSENLADSTQTIKSQQPVQKIPETSFISAQQETEPRDTVGRDPEKFGIFTSALSGEANDIKLENDFIELTYSTKGGIIKTAGLKEYDDYLYEKPLVLLDENSSRQQYLVSTAYGNIDLTDLYFDHRITQDNDTTVLMFTAELAPGKSIRHIYKLASESYQVSHQFLIQGLESEIAGSRVSLIWHNYLKRLETDIEYNRTYTTINYWTSLGEMEELKASSSDKQEVTFNQSVNWFSFKQRFFTTGYVFNKPVSSGYFSTEFNELDTVTSKLCKAMIDIPLSNFTEEAGENIQYYGPNKLNILNKVAPGFKDNLYLGWPVVKWINRYLIITTFNFLEKYIGSYGIIIVILVFIIKIILSPLTYKSHISMAKTKALKPELDELKEKFGSDMQKMQAEQMKLYQQVGVNPLSGCIPMLLQMPILFAMFQFIPHAVELRHKSFLWAKDLSTYDSILSWNFDIPLLTGIYGNHVSLFTLLMTLSTILYTWINSQSTAQLQGPMKSMQYFMPIIFMFVLNKFPAGLTFYYFVSNIVSFGQIAIIRKFVDDDKIRAILEENKRKNKDKKKSKFQARLEDAMKASEAAKKNKIKK